MINRLDWLDKLLLPMNLFRWLTIFLRSFWKAGSMASSANQVSGTNNKLPLLLSTIITELKLCNFLSFWLSFLFISVYFVMHFSPARLNALNEPKIQWFNLWHLLRAEDYHTKFVHSNPHFFTTLLVELSLFSSTLWSLTLLFNSISKTGYIIIV